MKVFVLTRPSGNEWKVAMGADSGVLRPAEPIFLPESDRTAHLAVAPAIRIGRLGYCVRSNFKSYIDAATLFVYLRPHDDDTPAWLPPYCADRSFSPGRWLPIPNDGRLRAHVEIEPLPTRQGATHSLSFEATIEELEIERHIRDISKFCTIKTGDLLIFIDQGTPMIPAHIDTLLRATLNDENVLDVRLK